MTDRETWLSQIRSNPSDWQAMLVFADWLEDTEGDLLAAEQWRWIAAVSNVTDYFVEFWPQPVTVLPILTDSERDFAAVNNIRCMPRYPLTIEDVQAYLETAR